MSLDVLLTPSLLLLSFAPWVSAQVEEERYSGTLHSEWSAEAVDGALVIAWSNELAEFELDHVVAVLGEIADPSARELEQLGSRWPGFVATRVGPTGGYSLPRARLGESFGLSAVSPGFVSKRLWCRATPSPDLPDLHLAPLEFIRLRYEDQAGRTLHPSLWDTSFDVRGGTRPRREWNWLDPIWALSGLSREVVLLQHRGELVVRLNERARETGWSPDPILLELDGYDDVQFTPSPGRDLESAALQNIRLTVDPNEPGFGSLEIRLRDIPDGIHLCGYWSAISVTCKPGRFIQEVDEYWPWTTEIRPSRDGVRLSHVPEGYQEIEFRLEHGNALLLKTVANVERGRVHLVDLDLSHAAILELPAHPDFRSPLDSSRQSSPAREEASKGNRCVWSFPHPATTRCYDSRFGAIRPPMTQAPCHLLVSPGVRLSAEVREWCQAGPDEPADCVDRFTVMTPWSGQVRRIE